MSDLPEFEQIKIELPKRPVTSRWYGDMERLGYLPQFVSDDDPRSAKEQLHSNYAHGGGWHPFNGFNLKLDMSMWKYSLQYPGDPPYRIVGFCILHAESKPEVILVFEHSWVVILDPLTEAWECARMD